MTALLRRVSAALVVASLTTSPALAQSPPSEPVVSAEGHFALGTRFFAQRSFAAAAREFQLAYASEHRVELLYNIGRAMEGDGQLRLALDAYRRFLQSMPVDFDRAPLHARITDIEQRLAREPDPILARASVVPVRRPPPPVVRRDAVRSGSPPAGAIALLAGGGAVLIGAAVLGHLEGAALSGCRVEGDVARCPTQDALDRATDAPGLAAAANASFTLGAVALLAGATWWILAPSRRVAMSAGPGSVSLALRW